MSSGNHIGLGRTHCTCLNGRIKEGCWDWPGTVDQSTGYGRVNWQGKYTSAHRAVYELVNGPIADGLHIDHRCRNRRCVNPGHLEAVTPGENVLRGEGVTAENARKDACVNGHPFDEENTYVTEAGRACRTCRRDARRRYEATEKGRAAMRARKGRANV